jgi:hypothetical protein
VRVSVKEVHEVQQVFWRSVDDQSVAAFVEQAKRVASGDFSRSPLGARVNCWQTLIERTLSIGVHVAVPVGH